MQKKNSHEIFADFYADIPSGGKRMAAAFGVHNDTAVAWSRPKASEINPFATGKANTIDQTARAMRVIHPHDPARAKEIVDYLRDVLDEMDRAAGLYEAVQAESPCAAIGRVVENMARLVNVSLGSCDNPEMLEAAYEKTRGLSSSVKQLESCLHELLRKKERKPETSCGSSVGGG